MTTLQVQHYLVWFFLIFFLGSNLVHLILHLHAVTQASRYLPESLLDQVSKVYHSFEPPVSLIVTGDRDEPRLPKFLRSLFELDYPEYEIVVVLNDPSETLLQALIDQFGLVVFPEAYRIRLSTQPVRSIYASTEHSHLRVVHKEGGDRSDALNAGINAARYPLYCSLSTHYILQRSSLQRVVRPFVENQSVVMAGGGIRLANRAVVDDGMLVEERLPKSPILLWRNLEILKAFLLSQLEWMPFTSTMLEPGFMGVYQKEAIIDAGGYQTGIMGEDLDLLVRIHRQLRTKKRRFTVAFIPEPYYWTQAAGGPGAAIGQRIRAQRATLRSLLRAIPLIFNPRGGVFGWFNVPILLCSEGLAPWVEVGGLAWMTWYHFHGPIGPVPWLVFVGLTVGYGLQKTLAALLVEEILHPYGKWIDLITLTVFGILMNLGPRQIGLVFRLLGYVGSSRRAFRAAPAPAVPSAPKNAPAHR